jgi:hypothetical protein
LSSLALALPFSIRFVDPLSDAEVAIHDGAAAADGEAAAAWAAAAAAGGGGADDGASGAPPEPIASLVASGSVPRLVGDPERRFALQLAWLRRYPKFASPCCGAPMCFKCKTAGHHPGRTCEEVQKAEAAIGVQCCPGCGVPTVRAEGCNHMICPCGHHWQWQ